MNIKKIIFVIFLFLTTLNNSYSIEADIFVQSTVNRASKILSEDISKEEIIATNLVSKDDYLYLEDVTKKLFQRGTEHAREKGLILVDTKYEFGKTKSGKIVLIDEIHTPDSSRYFYLNGYQERQDLAQTQKQLSKEFVREWLIENGFQGKEGQTIPHLSTDFINSVSNRYIELFNSITGEIFQKGDNSDILKRIEVNVMNCLSRM